MDTECYSIIVRTLAYDLILVRTIAQDLILVRTLAQDLILVRICEGYLSLRVLECELVEWDWILVRMCEC